MDQELTKIRSTQFNELDSFVQRKNNFYKTIAFPLKDSPVKLNEASMKFGFIVAKNSRNKKMQSCELSQDLKKFKVLRIKKKDENVSEIILVKPMNLEQKFIIGKENKSDYGLAARKSPHGKKISEINIRKCVSRENPLKSLHGKEENSLRIKTSKFYLRKSSAINQEVHFSDKEERSPLRFQKVLDNLASLALFHRITPIKAQSLKVYIGKGNNSSLVRQVMKQRWWWEITDSKQSAALIWTQIKDKQFYLNSKQKQTPTVHNHLIWNDLLGNKKSLYHLMRKHYDNQSKDVFNFLPETFHITKQNDEEWKKFAEKFQALSIERNDSEKEKIGLAKNNKGRKNCAMWIVKPGQNSNRGYGIIVCKTLDEIQAIVKERMKKSIDNSAEKHSHEKESEAGTVIIQKYITKPFLYNRRKFDIRCFMLLVKLGNSVKGYWCKEGYIRTSSEEFDLTNYKDSFVHLTNDAIQCNSEAYGKFEDGNKISFGGFQRYLDAKFPKKYNFMDEVFSQLRGMSVDILESSREILQQHENSNPVFEFFGLDFMIDDSFKPWLIEVNSNPCIENSCNVLKCMIPKILNDAFRLSIDVIFPPPMEKMKSQHHLELPHSFQLIFDSQKTREQLENPAAIPFASQKQVKQNYDKRK